MSQRICRSVRRFTILAVLTVAIAVSPVVSLADGGVAGFCGPCDAGGICDSQLGINGTFTQSCGDGQWISLAFPFAGNLGASIDRITMVHHSNTGVGDLYLMGGDCFGPHTTNIYASLGPAIVGAPSGVPVNYDFAPVVSTTDIVWVVAVFETGFSFDVMNNGAGNHNHGAAYINLSGGAPSGRLGGSVHSPPQWLFLCWDRPGRCGTEHAGLRSASDVW